MFQKNTVQLFATLFYAISLPSDALQKLCLTQQLRYGIDRKLLNPWSIRPFGIARERLVIKGTA